MRSIEMSAKTVEAAVQAACEALGVDRDDINVSYEVLEFPARKLFKTIPAKVLVKVEEPEVEEVKPVEDAPAPVELPPSPQRKLPRLLSLPLKSLPRPRLRKTLLPMRKFPWILLLTRACRPLLIT